IINKNNCKNILDIGCGAGVFYHLLQQHCKDFNYVGIDLSKEQINRAKNNFDAEFINADASEINYEFYQKFDAIHVNSVFPFMTIDKQLKVIEMILKSGAWVVLKIGATLKSNAYVPNRCFTTHRNKDKFKLTALSWPYRYEVDSMVNLYKNNYEI